MTTEPLVYLLVRIDNGDEIKADTYVGFTPNPSHIRLRKHLGLKSGGAKRTRGKVWRFAVVVKGFKTQQEALSFEWHWQRFNHVKDIVSRRIKRNGKVAVRRRWRHKAGGKLTLSVRLNYLHAMLQEHKNQHLYVEYGCGDKNKKCDTSSLTNTDAIKSISHAIIDGCLECQTIYQKYEQKRKMSNATAPAVVAPAVVPAPVDNNATATAKKSRKRAPKVPGTAAPKRKNNKKAASTDNSVPVVAADGTPVVAADGTPVVAPAVQKPKKARAQSTKPKKSGGRKRKAADANLADTSAQPSTDAPTKVRKAVKAKRKPKAKASVDPAALAGGVPVVAGSEGADVKNATGEKKKPRKKKTEWDLLKPKRAKTAFVIFSKQERPNLMKQHPGQIFDFYSKETAKLWKTYDAQARIPFDLAAEQDKIRYKNERKETDPPTKPRNSFTIFNIEKRAELKETVPKKDLTDVIRTMWAALSPEDKAPYLVKKDADRVRYEREHAEWEVRLEKYMERKRAERKAQKAIQTANAKASAALRKAAKAAAAAASAPQPVAA